MTAFTQHAYPPRGLRRSDAARYIGVGASKFDELVQSGRMPKPKHVDGCVIWDRAELDLYFTELASDDASNLLDELMGAG